MKTLIHAVQVGECVARAECVGEHVARADFVGERVAHVLAILSGGVCC
jgi:hypothetical protein